MSIVPLPGGLNRRECLAALAAAGVALPLSRFARAADDKERLKVAAVITEFTYRSHAHVILENFLEPYLFNGQPTESGMDVVSMYVDQFPEGDMARDVAKRYGFTIYPTIAERSPPGAATWPSTPCSRSANTATTRSTTIGKWNTRAALLR
ncbi:MAG: hypothetical protein R3C10_16090 [Pirellulales bacterium]